MSCNPVRNLMKINGNKKEGMDVYLKGVFAKNERVYRLTANNNLTSILWVYKENVVKNDRRTKGTYKFSKLQYLTCIV